MRYAGIGARATPPHILSWMTMMAQALYARGYLLRSGGARGADQAFERGHPHPFSKSIFKADDATPEAYDLAAKYHPAWERCDQYAQALHARNGMILLGKYLNDPVDFVVCWTPGAQVIGGTGQALRLAEAYGIKVYNAADDAQILELYARVG